MTGAARRFRAGAVWATLRGERFTSHVSVEPVLSELRIRTATRYLQPLREGGSLPAVVETDDGGLFVTKFRGAGQGAKALIAELVAGLLAQHLELPTPELSLIVIPPTFGRSEPDSEIQDILRGSHGVNVGARYLDGAFNFDPSAAGNLVSAALAARIVWFDAYLTNPDRTARNPNILIWDRRPWLIDHGAALYAHHDWEAVDDARTRSSFPLIRQHTLLGVSGDLVEADAELTARLDDAVLGSVLASVPDELLASPGGNADDTPAALRERYRRYLSRRLASPRAFVVEAIEARDALRREPPSPMSARR